MESKKKSQCSKVALIFILIAAVIILSAAIPQHISKTVTSELSVANAVGKAPTYAAHRGLSSLYPQNTVEAFEAAAKAGYYAFECDVHTTADGQWVVIHDDTVDAMTDGSGEVEKFTLEEIKKLDIDSGNGIEKYPNLKVPTLEETLEVCDKYGIVPIIELKKLDVKYLPDFMKILEKHDLLSKAVLISFNFDYLVKARELNDKLEMMYLVKTLDKKTVDKCIENGNIGIDFKFQNYILCAGALRYAKNSGLKLGAWTVDNTIYSDIMRAAGVELITTNRIIPTNKRNAD